MCVCSQVDFVFFHSKKKDSLKSSNQSMPLGSWANQRSHWSCRREECESTTEEEKMWKYFLWVAEGSQSQPCRVIYYSCHVIVFADVKESCGSMLTLATQQACVEKQWITKIDQMLPWMIHLFQRRISQHRPSCPIMLCARLTSVLGQGRGLVPSEQNSGLLLGPAPSNWLPSHYMTWVLVVLVVTYSSVSPVCHSCIFHAAVFCPDWLRADGWWWCHCPPTDRK